MIFKSLSILVLWTKVASALEGVKEGLTFFLASSILTMWLHIDLPISIVRNLFLWDFYSVDEILKTELVCNGLNFTISLGIGYLIKRLGS